MIPRDGTKICRYRHASRADRRRRLDSFSPQLTSSRMKKALAHSMCLIREQHDHRHRKQAVQAQSVLLLTTSLSIRRSLISREICYPLLFRSKWRSNKHTDRTMQYAAIRSMIAH